MCPLLSNFNGCLRWLILDISIALLCCPDKVVANGWIFHLASAPSGPWVQERPSQTTRSGTYQTPACRDVPRNNVDSFESPSHPHSENRHAQRILDDPVGIPESGPSCTSPSTSRYQNLASPTTSRQSQDQQSRPLPFVTYADLTDLHQPVALDENSATQPSQVVLGKKPAVQRDAVQNPDQSDFSDDTSSDIVDYPGGTQCDLISLPHSIPAFSFQPNSPVRSSFARDLSSLIDTKFASSEDTGQQNLSAMSSSKLMVGPAAFKKRAIQEAEQQQRVITEKLRKLGLDPPAYQFRELIGKGTYGRVYKR